MFAKLHSGALSGVEALPVDIEVNSGESGEPKVFIVGLPDAAVKESFNRVSSAMANSGFSMPTTKTTVNLAPGDIKKEGPIYDLPISLGILASLGQIPQESADNFIIAGELSLSGKLRAVCGGVSLALLAKKLGKRGVILPPDSAYEASLVDGIEVFAPDNLAELVAFLRGQAQIKKIEPSKDAFSNEADSIFDVDFADVKGQYQVRRAVEVAVAGGHNLLMVGPPGSGKSMIAKRIPTIMPLPSYDEFLEILGVYSAAGLTQIAENRRFKRPFRAPHHTVSKVGLTGGGPNPKPGEISLAHNGVLFLDELPEFGSILDNMRQPMEDGKLTISRAAGKITLPCKFMLVAAMNPCKCGYYGSTQRRCRCTPQQVAMYRARVSGPMLDRIDIHVEAAALNVEDIQKNTKAESSAEIRARVVKAREIQAQRFSGTKIHCNADMTPQLLRKYCLLSAEQNALLVSAMNELGLSARAWDRILKVSRTIADLEFSDTIETHHLLEAINYRSLDRNF
ncbi:MAG: ATP-binding protein [Verrucomicrobiaceae bacterium]|nr:ATP-binding protein [Verrucomicrobiaceae bacterium]